MKTPSSLLNEYTLSTDNFKQPKVVQGREAVGLLVARLILLEPGTDPIRPNMGLGLVSRYRDMFPNKLPELRRALYSQIETYLPQFSGVEITLTTKEGQLIFDIKVGETAYKYVTVEQEDNRVTLTELTEETY